VLPNLGSFGDESMSRLTTPFEPYCANDRFLGTWVSKNSSRQVVWFRIMGNQIQCKPSDPYSSGDFYNDKKCPYIEDIMEQFEPVDSAAIREANYVRTLIEAKEKYTNSCDLFRVLLGKNFDEEV
jgi:hypothetical protein